MTAVLLAAATQANICNKARPGWDGTPVSAVQEALFLFSTPAALVLVLATLIALRLRHQWGGLIVVVLWTVMASLITMADPTGMRPLASAEGCVGSATLFLAAVAAICVGLILYTAPLPKRADQPNGD